MIRCCFKSRQRFDPTIRQDLTIALDVIECSICHRVANDFTRGFQFADFEVMKFQLVIDGSFLPSMLERSSSLLLRLNARTVMTAATAPMARNAA